MTPPNPHDSELDRVADAETFQGYFPDHATDERHPQAGIDAVHHHFVQYLASHPGETT